MVRKITFGSRDDLNKEDKKAYRPVSENVAAAANLNSASRTIVKILRHTAKELGLPIQPDGYIELGALLGSKPMARFRSLSLEQLHQIVANDNKTRLHLKFDETSGQWFIRANQGHSAGVIDTESLLTRIADAKDFPSVVHGTYYKCLPLILTTGLNRMAREHIHFAPGVHLDGERKVISGMRVNCEVAIFIDLAQALADGILFFVSANRVLLTEGIHGVLPPKYFARVVDIKSNSPLTDRDIKMHTEKAALLTLPESTVPDTSTIIATTSRNPVPNPGDRSHAHNNNSPCAYSICEF